ncbi:pyridoxamine 5'-phosphate oxidase [Tunicatimonas pelagia]|uniref:pyridoxamine 5'-phosphate oxidase n=1 Tax=Tunicatimonas pelagia TaxID=931531 RepID=UPI0026658D9D|nr:pyridoxamine 5'-phosphate oxidase [Tunicatimonas pelagia]WKN41091.1 pyridoxamine 5'-phosphate oxidase [Tunicatimonas pelagia]
MSASIADMRQEYSQKSLDISDAASDPVEQFHQWFEEARNAQLPEPNAMHLATADSEGRPSGRIVLLKGIESQTGYRPQFIFYTNYQSRKGDEMEKNPNVALTFFWAELERQVRIAGTIAKVDEVTSTEYFHSRPRASQIGAWVSPQSEPIENREVLDQRKTQFTEKFANQEVPRPPHWGGYAVSPLSIEFWQGRPSRLHDRIYYQLTDDQWQIQRLAP